MLDLRPRDAARRLKKKIKTFEIFGFHRLVVLTLLLHFEAAFLQMERSFCKNDPFCRGNPRKSRSRSSSRIINFDKGNFKGFYLVKSQMSAFRSQIELLQVSLKIFDVDGIPTNTFFILLEKK